MVLLAGILSNRLLLATEKVKGLIAIDTFAGPRIRF
jgi:hypothetical protein